MNLVFIRIKRRCSKYIDEAITILETLRYDFFKEEKLEQALLDLSPESAAPQQVLSEHAVDNMSHGRKLAAKKKVQQIQHRRPTHSKNKKKPAPASVLIVSFPDGTVIQRNKAAETLAQTINRIGPEKVADLRIPADGGYLVSREGSRTYPESNYPLDDGFVLITHSSTDAKMDKLKKISKKLNLGLVVSKTPKHTVRHLCSPCLPCREGSAIPGVNVEHSELTIFFRPDFSPMPSFQ